MKVLVTVGGTAHRASLPHEGAAHVDVAGVACPACGKDLRACGRGEARTTRDAIVKRAVAACCGADVGEIAVHFETLFGLEEDEAVEESECTC